MALVHVLQMINPPELTEAERRDNLLRGLNPKPVSMHIDPEMVEIFHDLAQYRSFDEKTYTRCLKRADQVCMWAERVDIGVTEPTKDVCKMIEQREATCLELLARLYSTIKKSEAAAIEEREKSQVWRESAKRIGQSAEQIERDERIRQEKESAASATSEADEHAPKLFKHKLKHDIVRMYYSKLMDRLQSHVSHVRKMHHDFMKNVKAPVPGSIRKPKPVNPSTPSGSAASAVHNPTPTSGEETQRSTFASAKTTPQQNGSRLAAPLKTRPVPEHVSRTPVLPPAPRQPHAHDDGTATIAAPSGITVPHIRRPAPPTPRIPKA